MDSSQVVAVVASAAVLGVLAAESLIAAAPALIAAAIAVYEAVFVAELAFEFV